MRRDCDSWDANELILWFRGCGRLAVDEHRECAGELSVIRPSYHASTLRALTLRQHEDDPGGLNRFADGRRPTRRAFIFP